jgi:hypothetical protein
LHAVGIESLAFPLRMRRTKRRMWHAGGNTVATWTARAVLAHWPMMLLLAAESMQLVQDRIELVFQACNSFIESAIAARRTGCRDAWWDELRTARSETSAESSAAATCAEATTTESTATESATEAASSWAGTFGWTIAVAARLWPALGTAIWRSTITGSARFGTAIFVTITIARGASFAPLR